MTWDDRRKEAVDRWLKAGFDPVEPDTVWGTGGGNFPAVGGISGAYGLASPRGEIYMPDFPLPYEGDYFATKFASEFAERVYWMAMDGCESIGSVDELNHFMRIDFTLDDYLQLGVIYIAEQFVEAGLPIGAITETNDQGFVDVCFFYDGEEKLFTSRWNEIVKMYAEYYDSEEYEESLY
jgi:hypothetical protein